MSDGVSPAFLPFRLEWADAHVAFATVTGLTDAAPPDLRDGTAADARKLASTGGGSASLVLAGGVARRDDPLFRWLADAAQMAGERRDLVLRLLDEQRVPVATWKVRRAHVVKVSAPPSEPDGTDVALESLTLAHEGLELDA